MKKFILAAAIAIPIIFGGNNPICMASGEKLFQKTKNAVLTETERSFNSALYTNKNKKIKINYPQISGNESNASKINELIKNDTLKILKNIEKDFENLETSINFKIEYSGSNILSIQYSGLGTFPNMAHPFNIFYTTNIDIANVKILNLSDVVTINEKFVEKFIKGKYTTWCDDLDIQKEGALPDIIKSFDKKELLKEFRKKTAVFCFTKDSLVVSAEAIHAVGDHIEFAISYNDLEKLLLFKPAGFQNIKIEKTLETGENKKDSSKTPDNELKFKKYGNSKYGYLLSYPDIFKTFNESDSGDGVSMESADGLYTLKIWGGFNVMNSDGQALLKQAKERAAHISEEHADKNSYKIVYEGGDKTPIEFYECGYVTEEKVNCFILSYPAGQKSKFAGAVSLMAEELKKAEPAINKQKEVPAMELINDFCFSQILHYDSFTEKPDAVTATLTLYRSVVYGNFRWKDKLQMQDDAYCFNNKNKNSKDFSVSPDELYCDYFVNGNFQKAPESLNFLIENTKNGIKVKLSDAPYLQTVEVTSFNEKNGKLVVNAKISRSLIGDEKPVLLGDAVITLVKSDKPCQFGYKILSFEPKYPKFNDIVLR